MFPHVLVVFLFRSQHLCTTCSCVEDMKVHGMQLVAGSQSLPALSSGASASGSSVSGGGRGSARVYGLSCYLCGVKDDASDNVLPDLKRVWGYPPRSCDRPQRGQALLGVPPRISCTLQREVPDGRAAQGGLRQGRRLVQVVVLLDGARRGCDEGGRLEHGSHRLGARGR